MMHKLEMPNSLAGFGVQCDQAVGKQIVSDAVSAIKVGSGRSGGYKDDPAFRVERHPRPVVGCPAISPRCLRPCLVAQLAGVRNGMKRPSQLPAVRVEGAYISRR